MAQIAMTLLDAATDAPLAGHFGRAPWLGIFSEHGPLELIRNTALHGKGVAALIGAARCSDAIVGGIGPGAHARLRAAGVRVWQAPAGVAAPEALDAFVAGRLVGLEAPTHAGRRQGGRTC